MSSGLDMGKTHLGHLLWRLWRLYINFVYKMLIKFFQFFLKEMPYAIMTKIKDGQWQTCIVVFLGFFLFWLYGPFKNISLKSSQSFIKGGQKPENPGKNHLTIRKQNLAFPHLTRVRLEPQPNLIDLESALLSTRLRGPATYVLIFVCLCWGFTAQ